MEVKKIRDRRQIYSFLSSNPGLYLYLIGDLDEFFWPSTTWYALLDNNRIRAISLLYSGMTPSTLLAFYDENHDETASLLKSIKHELPESFNVHLGPELIEIFGRENIVEYYGTNFRMLLKGSVPVPDMSNIRRLDINDIEIMKDFYRSSYPGNWFDSRMVETGKYFGYFEGKKLVGIAGIHVYSAEYRIAALGNIATDPDYRGKKIAFRLTSALCHDLKNDTDTIGLNVKSDNSSAVKCYRNAGFEITGHFEECLIKNS